MLDLNHIGCNHPEEFSKTEPYSDLRTWKASSARSLNSASCDGEAHLSGVVLLFNTNSWKAAWSSSFTSLDQ